MGWDELEFFSYELYKAWPNPTHTHHWSCRTWAGVSRPSPFDSPTCDEYINIILCFLCNSSSTYTYHSKIILSTMIHSIDTNKLSWSRKIKISDVVLVTGWNPSLIMSLGTNVSDKFWSVTNIFNFLKFTNLYASLKSITK